MSAPAVTAAPLKGALRKIRGFAPLGDDPQKGARLPISATSSGPHPGVPSSHRAPQGGPTISVSASHQLPVPHKGATHGISALGPLTAVPQKGAHQDTSGSAPLATVPHKGAPQSQRGPTGDALSLRPENPTTGPQGRSKIARQFHIQPPEAIQIVRACATPTTTPSPLPLRKIYNSSGCYSDSVGLGLPTVKVPLVGALPKDSYNREPQFQAGLYPGRVDSDAKALPVGVPPRDSFDGVPQCLSGPRTAEYNGPAVFIQDTVPQSEMAPGKIKKVVKKPSAASSVPPMPPKEEALGRRPSYMPTKDSEDYQSVPTTSQGFVPSSRAMPSQTAVIHGAGGSHTITEEQLNSYIAHCPELVNLIDPALGLRQLLDSQELPESQSLQGSESESDDTVTEESSVASSDDMDVDNTYISPRRTAKAQKRRANFADQDIPTANKFAILTPQDGPSDETPVIPPQPTSSPPGVPAKSQRIPPIFLKKKERWSILYNEFSSRQLNYTKVVNTANGLKIMPATPADYRKIVRFLDDKKEEFFTYALPEDKPLSVVIRGIPTEFPIESVREDLTHKGYKVLSINRMKSERGRIPMPLLMVTLERSEMAKNIFYLPDIKKIIVRVEVPRVRSTTTQCYRCQGFGHTQRECRIAPRCVKCAGDHSYKQCAKAHEDPVKCVNCGGAHVASYRGCPRFPAAPKKTTTERKITTPATTPAVRPPVPIHVPPTPAQEPAAWPQLRGAKPYKTTTSTQPGVTRNEAPWAQHQSPNNPQGHSRKERRSKHRREGNTFTFSNVAGLISLVFRIGSSLNKAHSNDEAVQIILGFTQEIMELFNSNGK